MGIVLDPAVWGRARLLDMLHEQREGLLGVATTLARPDLPIRDPASLRTAQELVEHVLALTDRLDSEGSASDELIGRVLNVQYDTVLAAIDLMKSHSDVPKVPRSGR